MLERITTGTLLVGKLAIAVVALVLAESHEGIVVSVLQPVDGAAGKLVDTEKVTQKEHTHEIDSSVKITLDGKTATLGDLKRGDAVRVTVDNNKVTAVAATRK